MSSAENRAAVAAEAMQGAVRLRNKARSCEILKHVHNASCVASECGTKQTVISPASARASYPYPPAVLHVTVTVTGLHCCPHIHGLHIVHTHRCQSPRAGELRCYCCGCPPAWHGQRCCCHRVAQARLRCCCCTQMPAGLLLHERSIAAAAAARRGAAVLVPDRAPSCAPPIGGLRCCCCHSEDEGRCCCCLTHTHRACRLYAHSCRCPRAGGLRCCCRGCCLPAWHVLCCCCCHGCPQARLRCCCCSMPTGLLLHDGGITGLTAVGRCDTAAWRLHVRCMLLNTLPQLAQRTTHRLQRGHR